ncbi:hypothetical protein LIER_16284 [Lithospermum erythrorhizon]|uniref:Uncharacterized protein n=1 Tax=Lithospermum erythrorhizon TaxID=34254 RepID=A0AAV3Q997_LITER
MDDFNLCVRRLEFLEHPYQGNNFTWCRNWKENGLLRRLNRILCNEKWLELMNCEVSVPVASISDYCPIDVLFLEEVERGLRTFMFFEFWTKHEDYNAIIKEVWDERVEGNGFQILQIKLKNIKEKLRVLNKETFSNISCRVVEANRELETIQAKVYDGDLDPILLQHMLKVQNAKNKIFTIRDASGKLLTNYEDVKEEVMGDDYKGETEAAMKKMKKGKTPRPDGFSTKFFQHSWEVVKEDIIEAVKTFFVTCQMPKTLNTTSVVLISKVGKPHSMKEFMPISCYNII